MDLGDMILKKEVAQELGQFSRNNAFIEIIGKREASGAKHD
jgi:hypothetical protein